MRHSPAAPHNNSLTELLAFSCCIDLHAEVAVMQPPTPSLVTCQVLEEAAAIDAKAAAGQGITPLCGLPLAVKVSRACQHLLSNCCSWEAAAAFIN